MGYKRETVEILRKFRQNMGSDFYQEDARRIFRAKLTELPQSEAWPVSEKKLQYARAFCQHMLVGNFVKYIGVSGSVAAGIAKEEDDIDLFIVVKNNTLWIYRGLMLLKNLFNKKLRRADSTEVKDILCPNHIVEERGLKFEDDVFNLHEIYYLKHVYNPDYFDKILASNQWIRSWGGVVPVSDITLKRMSIFREAMNLYFFLPQLLFMFLSRHKPDVKRIFQNYLSGKIEFFPANFKSKVLKLL